jgi:predicted HD superfamily hydrolase involved in NAD metabolism
MAHTLGVAETAAKLAAGLSIDPFRARVTALLHDCAKGLSKPRLKSFLVRSGADSLEKRLPPLWHAPVGAYLAHARYGIQDPEVLAAIRWHSTGRAGMGKLEKLLFVSDFIEPTRKFSGAPSLRKLAVRRFDDALARVAALKIRWVLETGRVVHPNSIALWNWLVGN